MNKKIAFITGATRGIGKAIAHRLAANFFVIGTATSESGAEVIKQELGDNGTAYVLNMADREAIDSVASDVFSKYGNVSVLVNNAGITKDGLCMNMKDAQWDDVLAVDLSSVFMLTRALLPPMLKARYGRVINISSVVASMGNAGQVNYAAAKAGLEGFSRSLAKEVAKRNITVNCVSPGFIASDMTNSLSEDQVKVIKQNIPAATLGHVDDIAHAVHFLAQEESRYITGINLPVNGGLYV